MRRALALALVLLAAGPSLARADGDPASDILLSEDVFFPYAPNGASAPVRRALARMTAQARADGYPVEIAVIADRRDLGAYPYLISEPATYAELLAKELSINSRPRVIVVLPSGIGSRNLGAAGSALDGLEIERRGKGDGLARTAMVALGRVAAAADHPVAVPALARRAPVEVGSSKGGGAGALLAVVVPTALVLLGAVAAGRRRARRG